MYPHAPPFCTYCRKYHGYAEDIRCKENLKADVAKLAGLLRETQTKALHHPYLDYMVINPDHELADLDTRVDRALEEFKHALPDR
jgi:hypothetical protein